MDVRIPADLENGDYLLRAEVVALHVASQPKGAQFYMTCYQITIAGGTGANRPATVRFPGAYAATDPGILFNIYQATTSYKIPGPAVVSGGRSIVAGQGCKSGCEVTCKPGSGTTGTVVAPPAPTAGAPPAACSVPQFGQCGGQDYKGCTVCAVSLAIVVVWHGCYKMGVEGIMLTCDSLRTRVRPCRRLTTRSAADWVGHTMTECSPLIVSLDSCEGVEAYRGERWQAEERKEFDVVLSYAIDSLLVYRVQMSAHRCLSRVQASITVSPFPL